MLIKIKNYRLKTKIGVYDWERNFERKIVIDLEIETKDHSSFLSDDLSDSIDYEKIYKKIKEIITNSYFNLIETLAYQIVKSTMEDERIDRCKVEINKMNVFSDVESFTIIHEEKR